MSNLNLSMNDAVFVDRPSSVYILLGSVEINTQLRYIEYNYMIIDTYIYIIKNQNR